MYNLKIRLNNKTVVLFGVLFLAAYNDILRIPGTAISLYRIVQPFLLLYIFLTYAKIRKYIAVFSMLFLINYFQYCFFTRTNEIGIRYDVFFFIKHMYYYFCILTVICTVVVLCDKNQDNSIKEFIIFFRTIGCINVALMFLHPIIREYGLINIGNINDYGAKAAALLSVFILGAYRKRRIFDVLMCILSVVALDISDCRISLLGAVIEIILVPIAFYRIEGNKIKTKAIRVFLVFLSLVFLVAIIYKSKTVFIYLKSFSFFLQYLFSDKYFSTGSSLAYRINVIKMGIGILWDTKFVGIGVGNFGLVLRKQLMYLHDNYLDKDYISPHNAILEFGVEFGPIAVLIYGNVILKVIKMLNSERTTVNTLFILTFISVWIWILGPSGFLTLYTVWAYFAFLFCHKKQQNDMVS